MTSYETLAPVYDALTADVDHKAFAAFYERAFALAKVPVHTVLDLACGTGKVTKLLADRGYEMIGADASPEMLAIAMEKCADCGIRPLFLNQTMQELDLYGTVEACVCALDGFNYVPPEDMPEVLHRLRLFIQPGGILVFDINSAYKLKMLDGGVFVDETDTAYSVMRTEFDEEENALFYGLDLFTKRERHWVRSAEEHLEYLYTVTQLRTLLKSAGFTDIRTYSGTDFGPVRKNDQRLFFTALRKAR